MVLSDQCHRCKVRCSGQTTPCERCSRSQNPCTYSLGKPVGKPKGHKQNISRRPNRHQELGNAAPAGVVPVSRPELSNLVAMESFTTTFSGSNIDTDFGFPDPLLEPGLSSSKARQRHSKVDSPGQTFPIAFRDESTPPPERLEIYSDFDPRVLKSSAVSLTSDGPSSMWESAENLRENEEAFPLQIITRLYEQQQCIAWAPIENTLTVARQGLDAVSRYISTVPTASGPVPVSTSLLMAYLLVLQLSLGCYAELGPQAAKMFKNISSEDSRYTETLSIGGYTFEDSESCCGVLEALVSAERKRGQAVLQRLLDISHGANSASDDRIGFLELLRSGVVGAAT